jgi:hypothetical protein
MKQTAVEWLEDYIENQNKNGYEFHPKYNIHIVNKAKEMEMIQITEAFNDGFENNCDADIYYNKKFKPDYKNES